MCHPGTPSGVACGVTVRLARTPAGDLKVTYGLQADVSRLRIPVLKPARIGEKLWQHTCFEMFIARRLPSYHELNFSPSREWTAYAFSEYRNGAPLADGSLDPRIDVRTRGDGLDLDATVPLSRLSSLHLAGKLSLSLSAVIEDADGGLSYWALRHPPGKPDFHHPEAFALQLDEVRH